MFIVHDTVPKSKPFVLHIKYKRNYYWYLFLALSLRFLDRIKNSPETEIAALSLRFLDRVKNPPETEITAISLSLSHNKYKPKLNQNPLFFLVCSLSG